MPAPRTRGKYDTSVVYLFSNNKEHLLPDYLRRSIPASTISSWRNADSNSYIGSEIRQCLDEAFQYHELFNQHQKLKQIVKILAKTWISVSHIVNPFLNKHKT